jgi:hypothetical protein
VRTSLLFSSFSFPIPIIVSQFEAPSVRVLVWWPHARHSRYMRLKTMGISPRIWPTTAPNRLEGSLTFKEKQFLRHFVPVHFSKVVKAPNKQIINLMFSWFGCNFLSNIRMPHYPAQP